MKSTLLYMCMLGLVCCQARAQRVVYVSGAGDDTCRGSSPVEAVRTLGRALELAAADTSAVTVHLAEGVYRIDRAVTLTDSMPPLALVGEGMGHTVISGAVALPPFEVVSPRLWKIRISGTMACGADIQQLYVDGRRATPARTPNTGEPLWRTPAVTQTVVDSVPSRGARRRGLAVQSLTLPAPAYDAMTSLSGSADNVRVSFLHAWDMTRRHVETFDPVDSTMYVVGNLMKPWNAIDRESQFMLEGDPSFIDEPGEWSLDSEEGAILYYPLPGQCAATTVAEVPVLRRLVDIAGSADSKVGRVRIKNLTLSHTRYTMPRKGDEPLQAASRAEAAVMVCHAADVMLEDVEVSHTGGYGVWFEDGCSRSGLSRCLITDLGAGGVKIGSLTIPDDEATGLTHHITVDNCIIQSGGRVFPTGTGVLLTHASDCSLTHNDISDFYYTGISAGWVWGYGYSPSRRNYIGHNHIHHLGRGVLSDMGGIYTLGRSDSTVIERNVVDHVYSYSYGGWGIYADEGSSGLTIRDNLVHDCKYSAFHQHYGRDNVVTNNIFVNQMRVQLEASSDEPHTQFCYMSNIVCHTTGSMHGLRWDSSAIDRHHNLYWRYGGDPVDFGNRTLSQWRRELNTDHGSVEADPMLRDVAAGDYTPTNRRAMRAIGFRPFDHTTAGVCGDESWRRRARLPDDVLLTFDRHVEWHEAHPAPEQPLPVVVPKP